MLASFRRFIGLFILLLATIAIIFGYQGVSATATPDAAEQSTAHTRFENTSQLTTPQLIEQALANGTIGPDVARLYLAYALGSYDQLPKEYQSNAPWDGTFVLQALQDGVDQMTNRSARAVVESLLTGSCGSSSVPLSSVANSTYFHIEYSSIGGGLTIANYVTSLDTSWNTEVNSFGWAAPPVLGSNPPPGNRYHVRIENLGGGLYGYVSSSGVHAGFVGNNPHTTWNELDAYASCMVLNNNYSGFSGSPQRALDATTAHEFAHSIQFGYGILTGENAIDSNVIEGGATWMEDEVFDASDDNYNYLWPNFSMCMGQYAASPYPYWITWRGLTERHGTGSPGAGEQIMQDFWESASQSATNNFFPALNAALANKGTTLADAYHAYAITVKFNKSCGGNYAYPYCFEEGANYVGAAGTTSVHGSIGSVGSSSSGSIADNYTLNWISLPLSGSQYDITLQNTSGGGSMRGSIVCDTGSQLRVNSLSSVAGGGQTSTLSNYDSTGCTSVVAVITNQAQTADNPSSCAARSYQISTSVSTPFVPTDFIYLPYTLDN